MTAADHRAREEVYTALRRLGCANSATVARFLLRPGEDPDAVVDSVRAVLRVMEADGLVRKVTRKTFEAVRPDLDYSDARIFFRLRDVVGDALALGYSKSRIHDLVSEVCPPTFTMQHLVGLPKEEAEEWREEVEG